MVAVLQKGVEFVESRDLRRQDERLGLPVQCEVLASALTVIVAFAELLNLDFTYCLTDPSGSARLTRFEEDLGGRLREHSLGVFAVASLKLTTALEAKYHRVVRFPVLGNGCVELREPLQAC